MDIIVKKHWVYIGITGFIGVLLSFFIWNIYVSSKNPIIISLISTNPLLKNTQLNETLVTNVLKEYQYTYTKNSFFLQKKYACQYDETQSIGKRYRRQDEIGTPFCITYDFDSLNDNQVTIRERDSMKQERISIDDLPAYFAKEFSA
jgi:histidyl-tRNA synthetase